VNSPATAGPITAATTTASSCSRLMTVTSSVIVMLVPGEIVVSPALTVPALT
jgi:hypothetical protein